MRLTNPGLAVLGLLAVGAIALQLVGGSITLPQAGLRVAVAVGLLAVVDRVGLPLARALVGPTRQRTEDDEDAPPGG